MVLMIAAGILLAFQGDVTERTRIHIQTLQSDSVEDREIASKELAALGKAALPALEEAAKSNDVEVSGRVRLIIDSILDRLAPETLAEIELALSKANTLRLTYKTQGEVRLKDGPMKIEDRGTILVKQEKKFRADLEYGFVGGGPGERVTALLISDGDRLRRREPKAGWFEIPLPATFRESVAALLTRAGPSAFNEMGLGDPGEGEDARKLYAVSDVRRRANDGEGESLSFKVNKGKQGDTPMECTLWYDPKSFRLIQRKWKSKAEKSELGPVEVEISETNTEFVLNADIPDEMFKPPAEK